MANEHLKLTALSEKVAVLEINTSEGVLAHVHVNLTDEGVSADIYPAGTTESFVSGWALFNELADENN